MRIQSLVLSAAMALCVAVPSAAHVLLVAQSSTSNATANIDARPFPRQFTQNGTTFSVHQPQYDSWNDNQLKGRFAMSVDTGTHNGTDGKPEQTADYGVVTFQARTQIDKDARAVVLSDIQLTNASFPTATAKQAQYLELVRAQLKQKSTLTVSLDQLESALAIAAVDAKTPSSLPVRNDPPDILFSTQPAVLVLVDGNPALKPSGVAGVQRVINSRSLLLEQNGQYYTHLAGHWAKAASLDGPWTLAPTVDAKLTQAMQQAVSSKQVDTLDKPPQALADAFANGGMPALYVRTHPAELITVQGDPQFAAIEGTRLSYVTNTGADVFVDAGADNAWYVLVSGRWFTAPGSKGPWRYVAPNQLPAAYS